MLKSRILLTLAGSTILAIASPAAAQDTPAFRVPMGSAPTSSAVEATYAWLEQLGSCSTTCGTGTRTTTYQCQNVADYDYSGGGYGLPEADSACTASVGPKPTSTNASCTVYSGCGYDWVKPPVAQTPIAIATNPVGRLGCGQIRSVFSPYCQRTGGGSNVVMANGDHRFCSGDRPDYDPVAAGDPDALGYDRDAPQTGSCNTSDHEWRPNDTTTGWGSWIGGGGGDCDSAATRTRTVSCYRRFDNTMQSDTSCNAATRPASTQTEARYGSCSYSYSYAAYGAWSSGCDTNATRTRAESCIRSNNGGQAVALSECTSRGVGGRQATTETAPQYDSCSYAFQPTAWSGWSSSCDANATRTRSVPCVRSNNGGQTVADTECTNRGQTKPATSETGAQYGSCSYSFATGAWGSYNSSCSNNATRTRSVTCMRNNNGGTAVADSECTSQGVARPASSETTGQYGGCGYSAVNPGGWSGWASGCSGSTTRTRQYQCLRNNDGGQIVGDGECTGRGVSLTETQSGANYSGCTYTLQDAGVGACQSNNQAPHYWRCIRNQTGEQVDSAAFCGRPNPTYDACSYYSYELQDAGVGACQSNSQAPHYWRCIRRPDGAQVDSATYCGRSNPTYDACTYVPPYTYSIEDAGVGACQSNNQAPHYWRCRRSDGQLVDSPTYCGRSNPTYDSCSYYSYTIVDAGVGACQSNNQAPHYWQCRRNPDGAMVDSATYCGRSNPTYDACTYTPTYTYSIEDAGVGACQTNDQAPHYWRCRRSDGQLVDSPTYCGRANPTYDACSYPWGYTPSYGGWNACSGGTQTRSMTACTRSDGTAVSGSYCNNAGHPTTQSQSCTVTPEYITGDLCEGGSLLGQYEVFRSGGYQNPYYPPEREGGDRWVLDGCLTQAGRCSIREDSDWSEYGTYETYYTRWSCYDHSSGVSPHGSSDSWSNYGSNNYEATLRVR
jgi:hypothetical protein